jgi:hypothetical protein
MPLKEQIFVIMSFLAHKAIFVNFYILSVFLGKRLSLILFALYLIRMVIEDV